MVDVPWFMLSPGPASLAQYAILTFIGYRFFTKNVQYKRFSKLMALTDSAILVGLFVLGTDAVWCVACGLRWVPLFPQDTWQITSSFLRDVAATVFFFLFVGDYFRKGTLRFTFQTKYALLLCVVEMALWFGLAPSIPYTDYIQAWKLGYPAQFIIADFIFSHFLTRIPLWIAFVGVFPKD
jgi:hypothetical protein